MQERDKNCLTQVVFVKHKKEHILREFTFVITLQGIQYVKAAAIWENFPNTTQEREAVV